MKGPDACVVGIEIDARQRYLFETDKLQEMLGASLIMASSVSDADEQFRADDGLYLFGPVSGEIRAWSMIADGGRERLLSAAWELRRKLAQAGVEHTSAYMETRSEHFLQKRPLHRVPPDQSAWDEPEVASLTWVHRALTARITARKGAKSIEDARPSCSQFASCQLHAGDTANEWNPGETKEPRRGLRGFRAAAKFAKWNRAKATDFFRNELFDPVRHRFDALGVAAPRQFCAQIFADLAELLDESQGEDGPQRQNQFLAFICADGDGMGQVLPEIDWNDEAWAGDAAPWQRNADFSRQLDASFKETFRHAAAQAVLPDKPSAERWCARIEKGERLLIPTLPQLLGGDDLWMVARRDVAIPLAAAFASAFRNLLEGKSAYDNGPAPPAMDAVRAALAQVNSQGQAKSLSVSLGISFAKAGYPAWAMIEAAESLMASAKRLRKQQIWGRSEKLAERGCLDWHWIESSVQEGVHEAREKSWAYADGQFTLILTSRPWTALAAPEYVKAANELRKVPRRKREQLEQVLRLGYTLSLLAWERWWKGLSRKQRDTLASIRNHLAAAGFDLPPADSGPWKVEFLPWRTLHPRTDVDATASDGDAVYSTPFLDLLALDDIIGNRNPSDIAAPAAQEA